jgi:hypothetical protein
MSGCQTSDIPPIVPESEIGVTRADIEETKPNLKPPHALPASPPINLTYSHQLKSKISCVSCRYSCTDCWWVISVSDRCVPLNIKMSRCVVPSQPITRASHDRAHTHKIGRKGAVPSHTHTLTSEAQIPRLLGHSSLSYSSPCNKGPGNRFDEQTPNTSL